MSVPINMYHHEPVPCNSLPNIEATIPNIVKVKAIPKENTTDNLKAFFALYCRVPPTYPIIKGTLVREHGVNDVSIPAIKAKKGASHIFEVIIAEIDWSH
jgi:hypothetical protein